MAQVYFHCSSSGGVWIDRSGQAVSDLAEARDRAACIVRSLIMERGAAATIPMTSYSFSRSHSCSARRTEGKSLENPSPATRLNVARAETRTDPSPGQTLHACGS